MLNRNAIFVNGFSRGGTTILTNLLASHPDVCMLGETHHVFKGHNITDSLWRIFAKCVCYDAPIIVSQWQDFFSPRRVEPRKPLRPWVRRRVDRVLYREKTHSVHPILNEYKSPDDRYTAREIEDSRLLCKNIDGMIYATDIFAEMYPDATFFGLVRNGLAICEGHLRRGRSAEEMGWRYQVLVDKMLRDQGEMSRYWLVRFEDLVSHPQTSLATMIANAGLDFSRMSRVRMQVRRVMDAQGNHRLDGGDEWDVVWLALDELDGYFHRDVDQNQIQRLSTRDRDAFLHQAGDAMERLGYVNRQADADSAARVVISFAEAKLARDRARQQHRREQRKAA